MSSPRFIITGTDTDIGKTAFAAALTGALDASYWKPVQAGTDDAGLGDSERVALLSGVAPSRILREAYRLETPCSPHQAAKIDGVTIEPEQLSLPQVDGPLVIEGAGGVLVPLSGSLLFADVMALWDEIDGVTIEPEQLSLPQVDGPLVIEGAGGVLVPLSGSLLFADVMALWDAPAILVARTGLGTINHSLLAIEALRARELAIHGVAFVGDGNTESERIIADLGNVHRLGRLPILPHLEQATLAQAFAENFRIEDFAA